MPALLLRTYHGSKILQFDTGSTFLSKIHISFYCQYAKFSKLLKAQSQFSKKFMDKFCSPFFVCLSLHISRGGGGYVALGCCALLRRAAGVGGAWGGAGIFSFLIMISTIFLYCATLIWVYGVLYCFGLYYIQFGRFCGGRVGRGACSWGRGLVYCFCICAFWCWFYLGG